MFKFQKDLVRSHVGQVDHHFYISGPVTEPEDYVDLIDALYTGKPNENIVIHLNTPGGRMDTTLQILNAIKTTDADVVCVADGEVASAGSLILFAATQIAVQPFSYVMIHDGSEGTGGKLNENLKQAQFSANLTSKLYHEIYEPFFSKEEIDSVLDGQDMWLLAEEVNERIVNAVAKLKEENAEE